MLRHNLDASEEGRLGWGKVLVGQGVDAHQGLQEVVARPRVEVAPRLPSGLRSVDLLDEVLGEDLVVLTSLDQGKSQQEERQENHLGDNLLPQAHNSK